MAPNITNAKTVTGPGMQPRDFCYWLQGFAELTPQVPTQEQWDSIREHLALVFTKVTSPVEVPDVINRTAVDKAIEDYPSKRSGVLSTPYISERIC